MDRRRFIHGLSGLAAMQLLSMPASAQQVFLNGELNHRSGTFDWTNGGGDPLRSSWRANNFERTLSIARLNLTSQTRQGLRATLQRPAFAQVDIAQVYEGKVIGDVMVSGNGWIALRPRPITSRWRADRSTMASWWTWTNRDTGERWEIIVPNVCGNFVLTRLGQAVPCVCIPEKDACP